MAREGPHARDDPRCRPLGADRRSGACDQDHGALAGEV